MTDACKAFSASIILAYTQDLLDDEKGGTERSVSNRKLLKGMVGDARKISFRYIPEEGWCQKSILAAIHLIDFFNEHIARRFGEEVTYSEGEGI